MPGASKRLLPVMAGALMAVGFLLPTALSPAVAGPKVPMGAPVKWSAELGPVPKALTNTAPALATITLPGRRTRLMLFWTKANASGGGFNIAFQNSINLRRNRWSAPGLVDDGKATTLSRPAVAPIGKTGAGQVIVAWKPPKNSQILYSIGRASTGNSLVWGPELPIPNAITSDAPAVYSAQHSGAVLVVWKAAKSDAIDFIAGISVGGSEVRWGQVGEIPRAATTTTPAIAEASTSTSTGQIFVVWKGLGRAASIQFATTTDPLQLSPKWSARHVLPATVKTGASPSAQAIGAGSTFPVLIVFRGVRVSTLFYLTLARNDKITGPLRVPHIRSANGTAINPGVLAAQAPDPGKVFYEPFVRACPGC